MSFKLILDSRAIKELSDSWNWYENRRIGLGNTFENEIYRRLKEIEHNPERYPQKRKPYRETKIKRFPFF